MSNCKTNSRRAWLARSAVAAILALPVSGILDAALAQVDEIVVMARKRAESLQTVPVSVSVMTGKMFDTQGAFDLQELEGTAPNLVIDFIGASPGGGGISIRGVSFQDIEKSFDPAVGVLIDGVYIGTNTAQLLNSFDFESVEVLRGPQGTLFGKNTIGGLLNVRRTRPTGELGMKGQFTFGENKRRDVKVVMNTPVVEDKLAAKLFYFKSEAGWHMNTPNLAVEPGRDVENWGLTLLANPADNVELLVTIEGYKDDTALAIKNFSKSENGFTILCDVLGSCADDDLSTTYANRPSKFNLDGMNISAEMNWDINDSWKLTTITGHQGYDEFVEQDFDGAEVDFFSTERTQDYQQFSQEVRLAGNLFDSLYTTVGAYYWHSEYTLHQETLFLLPNLVPELPPSSRATSDVDHESEAWAVFAQADWNITDALRLNVGGRYTWEDKSMSMVNGIIFEVFDGLWVPIPDFAVPTNSEDWSEFIPRVGVDYQINDDMMTYFTWSRGFKSGGFNGRAATAGSAATPYDPEKVESLEVGLKSEWFDNRLRVNVAAFHNKYTNKQEELQVPAPPPAFQETLVVNAADAIIRGVEVDITASLSEALNLRGSFGWTDAWYNDFCADEDGLAGSLVTPVSNCGGDVIAFGDVTGPFGAPDGLDDYIVDMDLTSRNLRRAPEFTWSVGANYMHELDLGNVVADVVYRKMSLYETTADNAPGTQAPTTKNLTASITYNVEVGGIDTYLRAYGRNMTAPKFSLASALTVAGLWSFIGVAGGPEYGAEFGFEF